MQNNEKETCQNISYKTFAQIAQEHANKTQTSFKPLENEVRKTEAVIDIIYPSVQLPSINVFNTVGEEGIRKMVAYHHDLLLKTKVGKLFPANKEAFDMNVNTTADFFVQALGGGDVFTSQHGEPRLRSRHFKVPIDESDREIWLAMYKKTLKELDFPKECLEEFWSWIEPFSIRMMNRRTTMESIKRFYWDDIKSEFQHS
jgi:hemoglobin